MHDTKYSTSHSLAATLSNLSVENIREGLLSFIPGPQFTPGRLNIFRFPDFEVMLDYAHNTDGFKQLGKFLEKIPASKKYGIIGCAGDRRDEDIKQMGSYAAQMFDEIIIRHDKDSRGRTNEEITKLMEAGIREHNPDISIEIISDETEALNYAISNAVEKTFIVVCSDEIQKSTDLLIKMQDQKKERSVNAVSTH